MISSESVATKTSASSGEERTASYTTPISGLPAISRSIFRGRRVEARRAGMTAIAFMDVQDLAVSLSRSCVRSRDMLQSISGLMRRCSTYSAAALRLEHRMN